MLASVPCLEAGEQGVEVSAIQGELLETEPRRIVTTVFRVTNKGSERREFIADIKLPDGWIVITRGFPFELGANQSDTRLVSFFVPQRFLAGKYRVAYFIKARRYPSISGFYTISVVVLPVTKLEVKLLEAPEYVIAGEEYRASFIVINESNVEKAVSIEIDSGEDLPATVDAEALHLTPGESKTVMVTVKTDGKMRKELKHRLQLTAKFIENEKTKAQATSVVNVIPRITGETDPFHKIPMEVTFRQGNQKNDELTRGFQTEVSGEGTLDEEGKRHVSFLFKGPDTQDESNFGERDESHLSYWTNDYTLHLGDRSYSLSPLTENYRYGRGIEGRVKLHNVSLGAYSQKTRWVEPEEKQVAGHIDYSIGEKSRISLNHLKKKMMKMMIS